MKQFKQFVRNYKFDIKAVLFIGMLYLALSLLAGFKDTFATSFGILIVILPSLLFTTYNKEKIRTLYYKVGKSKKG